MKFGQQRCDRQPPLLTLRSPLLSCFHFSFFFLSFFSFFFVDAGAAARVEASFYLFFLLLLPVTLKCSVGRSGAPLRVAEYEKKKIKTENKPRRAAHAGSCSRKCKVYICYLCNCATPTYRIGCVIFFFSFFLLYHFYGTLQHAELRHTLFYFSVNLDPLPSSSNVHFCFCKPVTLTHIVSRGCGVVRQARSAFSCLLLSGSVGGVTLPM